MEEPEHKICVNCKREIPAVNFTIHSVHCVRNIRVCSVCKEPVLLAELQEHHDQMHKLVPCKRCGDGVCGTDLEDHIRDSCGHTIKTCRFCELELPRHELPAHEGYCGVRTEQCADCGEFVMIKYRQLHLDSNHGFIRLDDDPIPPEQHRSNIIRPLPWPQPSSSNSDSTVVPASIPPYEQVVTSSDPYPDLRLDQRLSISERRNASSSSDARPRSSNVRPSSSDVRPSSSNVQSSASSSHTGPSPSNPRPSSSQVRASSSSQRPTSSNHPIGNAYPLKNVNVENARRANMRLLDSVQGGSSSSSSSQESLTNLQTVSFPSDEIDLSNGEIDPYSGGIAPYGAAAGLYGPANGARGSASTRKPHKRTNDQPQINTTVVGADKLQKDFGASRGAVKKRPAPPPPSSPARNFSEPLFSDPMRDLPYYSALQRQQIEERYRREQSRKNLANGEFPKSGRVWMPPDVTLGGHMLGSDPPHQPLSRLDARVDAHEARTSPASRRRLAVRPQGMGERPDADRTDEFRDVKPMTTEQFMERYNELQARRVEDEQRLAELRGLDRNDDRRGDRHASRQGDRNGGRQGDRNGGRQGDRNGDRHSDRHGERPGDRPSDRRGPSLRLALGRGEERSQRGEARGEGGSRFSQIKSELRELRRGLNEVTAPYNMNLNNVNLHNGNGSDDSQPLPAERHAGGDGFDGRVLFDGVVGLDGDGLDGLDGLDGAVVGDHERLPCEFCNVLVPAYDLVRHQTGCRPDLAQILIPPANRVLPIPPSLRSPSPLPVTPRSVTPPSSPPPDEAVIPCEFCTEALPIHLISEHQERCGREAHLMYPD